jgi:hypothetical protein
MASPDDMLTAYKNIVTAINGLNQTYLNINGTKTAQNVTAATLVKTGFGRVVTVSVIVAGSGAGSIYDTNVSSSTANVIYTIPNTVGITSVNLPVSNGIVVAPGTGQTVAISYS